MHILKYLYIVLFSTCLNTAASTFDTEIEWLKGKMAWDNKRYNDAAKILLPLANSNHGNAQFLVSIMYYQGRGLPKNDHNAFDYMQRSARLGHLESVSMLSAYYTIGVGVNIDLKKASLLNESCAVLGDAQCQGALAASFIDGDRGEPDYKQGIFWFEIHAHQRPLSRHFIGLYNTARNKISETEYKLIKSSAQDEIERMIMENLMPKKSLNQTDVNDVPPG